jgi:hypothetical protein
MAFPVSAGGVVEGHGAGVQGSDCSAEFSACGSRKDVTLITHSTISIQYLVSMLGLGQPRVRTGQESVWQGGKEGCYTRLVGVTQW